MSVETGNVTDINASGAIVDAMIVDIGEYGVTEYGWCLSPNKNPTINETKINNGSAESPGNYTNVLTGLSPSTKYYVRSYLTGSGQTIYGKELELTTDDLIFNIDYPKVNVVLGTGLIYNIIWTANINDSLRIMLYNGTSPYMVIEDAVANNGLFTWEISSDIPDDEDYKLVINSIENGEISSETPFFSINKHLPPIINSGKISSVSYYSAQISGSIEHFGTENSLIQHGHCWDTIENPTLLNNKSELGSKSNLGDFTSSMENLIDNTIYYVRAYATNSFGTVYGEQQTFITLDAVIPTVNTADVSDVNYTEALCGGTVTSSGTHEVTSYGVCWGTDTEPTILNNKTVDGLGTGEFTSNITDLAENTTYYIRAYAINSVGTAYGEQKSFETIPECIDYEGNSYEAVKIGNQWWMKENLNSVYYSDGTRIKNITEYGDWELFTEEDKAYCYYNNSSSNGDVYGALYSWAAAMNGASSSGLNPSEVQGICPIGWHLPSDSEWIELSNYLGGDVDGKIRETGTLHWNPPNTGATNSCGFTALPGGSYSYAWVFQGIGNSGMWWCSTESDQHNAWSRRVFYNGADFFRGSASMLYGFSVRCVKD